MTFNKNECYCLITVNIKFRGVQVSQYFIFDVLTSADMGKKKDLSDFDKNQIVMVRKLS